MVGSMLSVEEQNEMLRNSIMKRASILNEDEIKRTQPIQDDFEEVTIQECSDEDEEMLDEENRDVIIEDDEFEQSQKEDKEKLTILEGTI